MFGLQRQLLLTYFAVRPEDVPSAVLPAGSPNLLAQYDAKHSGEQAAGTSKQK